MADQGSIKAEMRMAVAAAAAVVATAKVANSFATIAAKALILEAFCAPL